MAKTAIVSLGEGFNIDPDSFEEADQDNGPTSPEEELALRIVARLRQGKPKAARDACQELLTLILLQL